MKQNKLYDLIIKRRSVRLFKQEEVPFIIIKKVVNAARLAPSAANLQFLEYLVIQKKELREMVFKALRWAAYICPKRNPPEQKRPMFYIILLINEQRTKEPNARDIGAAAENILLALTCFNLSGCWLQNIDKQTLNNILKINAPYAIDSVIAAGYPAESPKLEEESRTIKYWLDEHNRLHVPKRPLKDVLHHNCLKVTSVSK